MEDEETPTPPTDVKLIECGMCHRRVPDSQTITLGGRVLCFGCAGGWFDEDETED